MTTITTTITSSGSSVQDWAQTAAIVVATLLAFATYRANRRDRQNQVDERHLEEIAVRAAEVGATADEFAHGSDTGERERQFRQAQQRLHAAYMFVPHEIPTVDELIGGAPDEICRRGLAVIAAAEIAG